MKHPIPPIVIVAALALLGAGACRSQQATEAERKVAELEKQLEDSRKQLEAEQAAAPAMQNEVAVTPVAETRQEPLPKGARSPVGSERRQASSSKRPPSASGTEADAGRRNAPQPDGDAAAARPEAQSDTQVQQHEVETPKPREITIPSGTVIPVRTSSELSTKQLADGASFTALLERRLVVGGVVLAEEGARVTGVVVSSDPGGRVKGVASLQVALRSIAGTRGNTIGVRTTRHTTTAEKAVARDAARTGVLAGAGAVVGAIAGGGKGAAIGAGAGATAGVGTAMATRGKPAEIPAETLIEFRLTAPSTVVYAP